MTIFKIASLTSAWRFWTLLALTCLAYATVHASELTAAKTASPREELQRYIAELQQHPDDQALREQIIKLALTLQPPSAVPDEAIKLAGKAAYIFKNAKSESDFAEAANAYQEALLVAPWKADYYFNLSVAQEKAGQPDEAIASLKFYLMAAPDAPDRQATLERIGGLEYAAEQAAKEKVAKAEEQRKRDEAEAALASFKSTYGGFTSRLDKMCCYTYMTHADGGQTCEGCNEEEFNGSHWYESELTENHYAVIFPNDGTVRLILDAGTWNLLRLIGIPKGPTIDEISWSCLAAGFQVPDKSGMAPVTEMHLSPAWVEFWEDGSKIRYSCDRPVDPSAFSPHMRYQYFVHKRQ